MKITEIRKTARGRERVDLYVDGELSASIAAEIAIRAGLKVGTELDDTGLGGLLAEDAAWGARETALRYLSHRPRSVAEVRRKLLTRGYPSEIVEPCIEKLVDGGLLDDREFARAFVRERLQLRPGGRVALISKLRARGIEASLASQVADEALAEGRESEIDLARRALRKFTVRAGEEPARSRRRLFAFLARRGFSAGTAARLGEELLAVDDELQDSRWSDDSEG